MAGGWKALRSRWIRLTARLKARGRRVVIRSVLIFMGVLGAWLGLVDYLILRDLPATDAVTDLIALFGSGWVVYWLIGHSVRKILYPDGAVGIGSEPSPPGTGPAEVPGNELPGEIPKASASASASASAAPATILIVDDDPAFFVSAAAALRAAGMEHVHTLTDFRMLVPFLEKTAVSAVVLDLDMPHLNGTELLPQLREKHPEAAIIVLTGTMSVETAVECMRAGAYDYMIKPVERNRFVSGIRRALEFREMRAMVSSLQEHLLGDHHEEITDFHGILTQSGKMQDVIQVVKAVARSTQPVLVTGETGVGKELVAKALHELGRSRGQLVAENVAGLDDAVFSDALFGHRRGAYTGADQSRDGLLVRASGGTILLDEIGDLGEQSQIKLLRLLEEREYYPLGSDTARKCNARVICSTYHNLTERVEAGKFRKDLYYRLSSHHIHVPPLRERKEDIPLLVGRFLEEASESQGRKKPTVPAELFTLLSAYHFPGNVRELRAMIYDAVIQHKSGVLSLESFKRIIEEHGVTPPGALPFHAMDGNAPFPLSDRFPTLKEAEDYLVAEALKRARNNQGVAAILLGISRHALNKRLVRGARSKEMAT